MDTPKELLPTLALESLDKREFQKLTLTIYEHLFNYYTLEWLKNEERVGYDATNAFEKRNQLQLWYNSIVGQLQNTSINHVQIHFEIQS